MPFVQSKLANYTTRYINKKFGTHILIKGLDLSWLGSVQLKGIEIRDHQHDTLIFVSNLKTSLLDAKKIIDNKVKLAEVSLFGVNFNLKTYTGETKDNLTIFIDSFKSDKTKPKNSFALRSEKINLKGLNFKLYNDNKKIPLQFSAQNGGVELSDFLIDGPNVSAKIKKMYFTESRGFKINLLSTLFSYTKTSMQFKNTIVQTDNTTKLNADIYLKYQREDLKNFNNKVQFKANFKESHLAVKDLNKLYREFKGQDLLQFTGNLHGTLNNFKAKNLRLRSKSGIDIKGNFDFINSLNSLKDFVFRADIKKIAANYHSLKNILPNIMSRSIASEFQKLGKFNLLGFLELNAEQLQADLSVNSALGTAITQLQLSHINTIETAHYTGDIEFKSFDLGAFASKPMLGKVSLKANLSGEGFKTKHKYTKFIGKIDSLEFNNYPYKDIQVNGEFQNKKFIGFISSKDKNFNIDFQGIADFSSTVNKFNFKADINNINLKETKLFTRDSIAQLKGNLNLRLLGNTFDDVIGKAEFKNIVYTNQKQAYTFKAFSLNSELKEGVKTIELNSENLVKGKIKGSFLFKELLTITQNALGSVYANYKPAKVTPGQFLAFDFTIYNQIIDVFFPRISVDKNTVLRGKINSDENLLKLTFSSPKISLNNNLIADIVLRLDNKNPLYSAHITAGKVRTKYYNIEKLNLLNRIENDTLFFKSLFKGGENFKENFNLDFYYTINADEKGVLGIQKSTVNYKGFSWVVNPKNDKQNKVSFSIKDGNYTISPFVFVSGEQKIEVKGELKAKEFKNIQANFSQVKLKSFLPAIDSLALKGKLSGRVAIEQTPDNISPKAKLLVENFKINNFEQGNLHLTIAGDNSFSKYTANMSLENQKAKSISARGSLDFSSKRPQINLDFSLQEYQIEAFSPLGQEVLSHLRGKVSGNFTARGVLRNPDLDGMLKIEDVGLTFPYLNVDYKLKGNTFVELEGQQFKLNNIILEDSKHKTQGVLSGYIAHQNFEMWFLDLDISTDNLLILDTREDEQISYYGTGYLK
ncbi:MAG: translocation/assembly module TamB domain-containing protein [Tenacibaculum sp.]